MLNNQTIKLKNDILDIEESLEDFAACKVYPSFEAEKKLIQKFNDLCSESEVKKENVKDLEEQINSFSKLTIDIKECEENIKDLKKQLPDVCPLCGAAMKDGRCINE